MATSCWKCGRTVKVWRLHRCSKVVLKDMRALRKKSRKNKKGK